jgi:hypothetical protein
MRVILNVNELMAPEIAEVARKHALERAVPVDIAVALEDSAGGDAWSKLQRPEN